MKKIPYGAYSKELREEAIKMVKEGGLTVSASGYYAWLKRPLSKKAQKDYQKLLKQFNMRVSMSRKGNCYDNAPIGKFSGDY